MSCPRCSCTWVTVITQVVRALLSRPNIFIVWSIFASGVSAIAFFRNANDCSTSAMISARVRVFFS